MTIHPETCSLDMESVLADTHRVYVETLNERHGTEHEYDDVTEWDWVQQDGRDFEEFMEIVENAWRERWDEIPTCDPRQQLIRSVGMLAREVELHIVTAREGVEVEMRKWLDGLGILPNVGQFHSMPAGDSKAKLEYDYYIDDKPHLADQVAAEQVVFLYDQPWNQHVEANERPNVYRVHSVNEAVELIYNPTLR